MDLVFGLIIIIAALLVFVVLGVLAGMAKRDAKKYGTSAGREFAGICAVTADQTIRKKGNKVKILKFLSEKGEASNADIQKYLGVASRTVVRYMDELEKEGIIEQVGKTGQGVAYRVK